jgi:hypothetical protein
VADQPRRDQTAAVMHDLNWWLIAVAFVLGLVLTLSAMIGEAEDEQR